MENCSKRIEELVRGKGGEVELLKNENDYLINQLLKNVMEIVKQTNRLTTNCLYESRVDVMSNDEEIKKVQRDLLKTVHDLLVYSSNEKTKNSLTCELDGDHLNLANNYHIISNTLYEIMTRSKDCFRFFHVKDKEASMLTCKSSKLEENFLPEFDSSPRMCGSQRGGSKPTDSYSEEEEDDNSKGRTNPDSNHNHTRSEDTNLNARSGEEEERDNTFQLIYQSNILHVQSESEGSYTEKTNEKKTKKEMSKSSKKRRLSKRKMKNEETLQMVDNFSPFRKGSRKIQYAWLHLINNYITFFIPRLTVKHNRLTDLERGFVEAVECLHSYIQKKKKLLQHKELFNSNKLRHINCGDIFREIFKEDEVEDSGEGRVEDSSEGRMEEVKTPHSYSSLDDSSEDLTMIQERLTSSPDEYFFWKMLKRLDKDINRYAPKYSNLGHPYSYEINDMINRYHEWDESVSPFLKVIPELKKPLELSEKECKIISTEGELLEMVRTIKSMCTKMSLSPVVNYKNTYRGFTSLILVGTEECDYIIDTLYMFEKIHELNDITTDPNILKILYKSKNIIPVMQKDFSIYFVNMIDISVCSDFLSVRNSLHYLVHNYFHVNVNSAGNGLNALTRPLSPDLVSNLRMPFHYLYYLFEYVKTDLYFNYIFAQYRRPNHAEGEGECEMDTVDAMDGLDAMDAMDGMDAVDAIDTLERLLDQDRSPQRNVYVHFENIKFEDTSEEERKYGEEIIRKVFRESNKMCLLEYKVKDMCDVEKTKEKIKTIIKTSNYNSNSCDTLIENILLWREKLAKKNDEPPDSIINIHTIISIILNMPTSISSLKNNIIPMSNQMSENLETLFEIIIKSNMKKKTNPQFYRNFIQNEKTEICDCNSEEELNSVQLPFAREMSGGAGGELIDGVDETNGMLIVPPKMHFQSISEEAQRDVHSPHGGEDYGGYSDADGNVDCDGDDPSYAPRGECDGCGNEQEAHEEGGNPTASAPDQTFTLEKTFFGHDQSDEEANKKCKNIDSRNAKYENYALLSSLLSYVKEKNQKMCKTSEHSDERDENVKTEEDGAHMQKQRTTYKSVKRQLPKDIAKNNSGPKKIKQIQHQSYNQQYNIKNKKGLYSKNILSEMNKKWNS
ncbi:exosome complex exonuclease RRP6, putative [Plasmodium knowlesi strain H]|uniref:Exosome complex exonuclease RRP6, putative n=3 Tax=Plasmodium knowlesi TaxID=5850 RepID=A0A5K1UMR9_PLAKH|nr:exosome complex exonuclease RRP6, putative [Plasmodium knowlesi strain H]OTN65338.1 putative 3'-5' exonuclease [Plasmodium knowlesi]CAA9989652.1 exosome complex exonuclease RRP6, putative [Plasmodium knowlesi strain H]SBO22762.1 exosome complex exonuclease RRP6, putative [Plasmodium knowlesi strain H]SBO23137.1 exosome complex exonuclease RRP6, putative [Plasmodium knowlesi strain H]VVS79126.1 exosome complex exonuclease RRP6, putative [Plasmodium knowlesi strain H]|eukprot:XP_002260376.1 3'-5' exonuclease, putative [Plasmodium knowlesi strain H]